MVVLSAIGRFFKKIWDWIKQTAWIQPLLIVGIIFGVIFSIPSIVKAVNASKKEKSTYAAYYESQYRLSLEVSAVGAGDSKADKFATALADVMRNGDETKMKAEFGDLGDKFFVAFVAKDCTKCEEAKEGFATFDEKLNVNASYMTTDTTEKFKLVTIFTDDENKETEENKTAFVSYLDRHQDLFEFAGGVAETTAYYQPNKKINASDIEALSSADPDNFLTPTIFLVELSAKSGGLDAGVTEVMFGVEGSDKNEKARTLYDCWTHSGDFSYNPSNN